MATIYLAYKATTPVDAEVCRAMLPFLPEDVWMQTFGNPPSTHAFGQHAHDAVDALLDDLKKDRGNGAAYITAPDPRG